MFNAQTDFINDAKFFLRSKWKKGLPYSKLYEWNWFDAIELIYHKKKNDEQSTFFQVKFISWTY